MGIFSLPVPAGQFVVIHVWVPNYDTNTVSKVRTLDGVVVGSYATPAPPRACCWDGENVWVGLNGGSASKFRGSDGTLIGTYASGFVGDIRDVAYDPAGYVWLAVFQDVVGGRVVKMRVGDGAVVATSAMFASTIHRVAYHRTTGTVWVAATAASVYKCDTAANLLQTIGMFATPWDLCATDDYLFAMTSKVSRITAANGAVALTPWPIESARGFAVFDGTVVRCTPNQGGNTRVTIVDLGNNIVDQPVVGAISSLCYDGSNFWGVDTWGPNLYRIDPATNTIAQTIALFGNQHWRICSTAATLPWPSG